MSKNVGRIRAVVTDSLGHKHTCDWSDMDGTEQDAKDLAQQFKDLFARSKSGQISLIINGEEVIFNMAHVISVKVVAEKP